MHGRTLRDKDRRVPLLAAGALVAVVAVGAFLFWALRDTKGTPEFPSLADQPDASLVGTVAYLDWEMNACLRVVPAAGGPVRTVACLTGVNAGTGVDLGWLDDGRVAVTAYGEWQKIVDVTSGAVDDVPAAQVPQLAPDRRPVSVSEDGRRLTSINDGGRVQIVLEEQGETRVLLDTTGGTTYEIGTPRWSPDETFVLTADSAARLLVTTLDDAPVTRVLATELGGGVAVTALEF